MPADSPNGPGLCPSCSASWQAWLGYTSPPPPIRLDGTGIRTVRDVREAQERRARDHYALIRQQQALIVRICTEVHQPRFVRGTMLSAVARMLTGS